jgi:predicted Ser/Thr protein kinase
VVSWLKVAAITLKVHLMYVLEQSLRREQLPPETEKRYLEFIKGELALKSWSSIQASA